MAKQTKKTSTAPTPAKTRRKSFLGIESIGQLIKNNCTNVPYKKGIFLILRSNINPPSFLQTQLSKTYYSRLKQLLTHIFTLQDLHSHWVSNSYILYVGCGGNLNQSCHKLVDFAGKGKKHVCGAKYIWALDDCHDLLFCWICLPNRRIPVNVKGWILRIFKRHHGVLPFANIYDISTII